MSWIKDRVGVLDFAMRKRISPFLKTTYPHPWTILPENIAEGNIVKGKVVETSKTPVRSLKIQPV